MERPPSLEKGKRPVGAVCLFEGCSWKFEMYFPQGREPNKNFFEELQRQWIIHLSDKHEKVLEYFRQDPERFQPTIQDQAMPWLTARLLELARKTAARMQSSPE